MYSLGEHFPPHPELRVRPTRNIVDVPGTDSLAIPPYPHFHHRFIHRIGLHLSRNPELLSSVSSFTLGLAYTDFDYALFTKPTSSSTRASMVGKLPPTSSVS